MIGDNTKYMRLSSGLSQEEQDLKYMYIYYASKSL